MSLKKLVYSDLFVASRNDISWFKATPDSMIVQQVPDETNQELVELRKYLNEQVAQHRKNTFRIDWPPGADGIRLRVERIPCGDEQVLFVCRRFRLLPSKLAALGVPGRIAEKLMAQDLDNGLVIFFGKAGSGKTTTAGSYVIERLSTYGGVCWTIENPIELPLQGKHGLGWCYQTEVPSDSGIGPAVRNMLRASPNLLFIGEIRDAMTAREAIAAGTSGHLVIATCHSADLLSGIARFARLLGDNEAAFSAIADSLQVGIHLSLHNEGALTQNIPLGISAEKKQGTGTPPRILHAEPLWLSGAGEEGVRSIVRKGEFHLLTSEIDRQKRNFIMGKLPS